MVIYFTLISLEYGEDLERVYKNDNREGWNLGAIASVHLFFPKWKRNIYVYNIIYL